MADKYERIRIFEQTMEICRDDPDLRDAISESVAGQVITWEEDPLAAGGESRAVPASLIITPDRSFAAAGKYQGLGKRICVLNFASSVTPGGGVTSGAGAQEESLCRISTLYAAISDRKTAGAFYDRHRQMIQSGEMSRKNRDDCIFTPGVTVIREDTFDCKMLPRDKWYSVDVITCAAPDLRFDCAGRIYQPGNAELTAAFEKRWRRILSVAAQNKADILILGAFGCGAFQNPPEIAAQAFSNVFGEYSSFFETVEFAVFSQYEGEPNYQAFSGIRGIREGRRTDPVQEHKDKLLINGQSYDAVFFHLPDEPDGYLSNWYPANFTIDGITFSSTEQYIMYWKCMLFGDKDSASAILNTDDPAQHQAIGRKSSGFNGTVWDGMKQLIAFRGLMAKFSQNEALKKQLFSTGDAYLVECAHQDVVWACGIRLYENERFDISKWRGKNILGFTLMEVREALRNGILQ